MRFCGRCGNPLASLCSRCGFENPPGFKFCGGCGEPLGSSALPPAASSTGEPTAERRQVTVLFCDLIESMALAERLDAEDLRAIVRSYQAAADQVIRKFEGHIAQFLGDGILIYFGYPVAHEDDPQRAVHTGLGIIKAIQELNGSLEREWGIQLAVRVGIHTGSVVAGEIGSGEVRERLALGQAPNIAARLQSLAQPGTVVVSEATYPFVQGFFAFHPLGARALKGVSYSVEVYQVLGESGVRNSFELAMARGLTPLVGRQDELSLLLRSLARVREGRGRAVLVIGEAGIGKSRLVHLFRERAADEVRRWLICRCSSFQQQSPFAAVIDLLQSAFHLQPETGVDERVRKLEDGLSSLGLPPAEVRPLFAPLLGLPAGDSSELHGLTAQRRKEKTLGALLALLFAMAEREPVVFAVEDLHWVDPSTLELIELLLRQEPRARLLTLLTFRPSFVPSWGTRAHVTQITLDRLSDREVEDLAQRVAGGALPSEVVRQIVSKTDGVPLFVEELTKMILGSGLLHRSAGRFELAGPIPPLAIPATLQDSLMARLDRLSAIREVVQIASVIGREFPWEMIRATCSLPEPALRRELGQLVAAELLYQRGVPPAAVYIFKHALIQDAAYGSLLKSARQQHHQRIAQVLEERFPEIAEARPELVAYHYTEAGLADRAMPCWLRAGRLAVERSANREAIDHLEKGLALLAALPAGPERDRWELSLRTLQGSALIATCGYAYPQLEHLYIRAQELCRASGEELQLFWALRGLWIFRVVRVALPQAFELGQRMMEIAEARRDPALLFEAHLTVALSHFYLGEFAAARDHLEKGLSLDSSGRDRSPMFVTGQDVAVTSLSTEAVTLWHLGYLDQALARADAAIVLARAVGHPYSLAYALNTATWLHSLRCDADAVERLAGDLLVLAEEKGFQHLVAYGHAFLGCALVLGGNPQRREEGFRYAREGLSAFRASGALLSELTVLHLLIETSLRAARVEEAERLLSETRTIVAGLDRFFWQSELFRFEGQLALAPDDIQPSAAELCFRQALVLARRQGSKSFELRTAIDLAQLLCRQGRRAEARDLLTPILDSFPKGLLPSPDLRAARALLGDLASH